MNIEDLQDYMRQLSKFIETSGSKKGAQELESLATAFEAYKNQTIQKFANFLTQISKSETTITQPAITQPKKQQRSVKRKQATSQNLESVIERIKAFYENVINAEVSYADIDKEIASLDKTLKAPEVKKVVQALEIIVPSKTSKAATLELLKNKLTNRKSSYERIQFR